MTVAAENVREKVKKGEIVTIATDPRRLGSLIIIRPRRDVTWHDVLRNHLTSSLLNSTSLVLLLPFLSYFIFVD